MKLRTKLLRRILKWRYKNLSDRQFIWLLSIVVGVMSGFGAVVIKNAVHLIQSLISAGKEIEYFNYLYFVFPAIGILLTVLFIKYILRKPIKHGIPSVLYAISRDNGQILRHNVFSSIIASSLTVGFGGSVGLEGPTVSTGAAMGSNLGRLLRLNYKQITLLLGCACAAAMSAIFKAPVAAIVFAIEVIMLDLTLTSMVPLLMASVSAILTSYLFLGQEVIYPYDVEIGFSMNQIHLYLIVGVLAGLTSAYFTRGYMKIASLFDKMKKKRMRWIIGGLALGALIFMFPSLYGEGYAEINSAMRGDYMYVFKETIFTFFEENWIYALILIGITIFLKVIAASVTFGAGGVGGIFAPTLFMGSHLGLFFGVLISKFGVKNIEAGNYAVLGMSGLIAGVLHAPLTAIFLIADLTGGYKLFLPLMIVSTVSFLVVRIFERNSVYTIQLARSGDLITHDKDKAALKFMRIDDLVEKNFLTIHPGATLGELVKVISKSERNIFPVVDSESMLIGIVFLNDIRHIVFDHTKYDDTYIEDLMFMPEPIVLQSESMEDVAAKFHNCQHYNLPVLKDDGTYVGFVSRANVFSAYRKLVRDFSSEL
ncbi:MAG: chloride channel protein [Bacteroidales bacterium]|jgi:CIC family chloride channel protein|nr:chloride channel protein [Bacteroidales bacterium]